MAVFVALLTLFRPGRGDVPAIAVTVLATILAGELLPGKWNVLAGAVLGAAVAAAGANRED